ncbi:RNA polymerase sigma factor [Thermomicrobiaceae bacterium CFH 74404]|uniref:RNA polymerase sigma factor n=1 Tax=Thermalbibacter longus TaxID=2951981 RepID=A0AA41WG71_9BACT|nr:RNA polymerase sigma factor [Thermalbibacter longus]MCM8749518.1 RNA polymerase sigma factor [Thermalbibacter longus]
MSDDELLAAIAAGDHTALRTLFERHAPWMAARLRRRLPREAVEDVLQETFIAVWRGTRHYRPQGAAGGWLWAIACRQAAAWLRRNGRAVISLDEIEPPRSEDVMDCAIDRVDLENALAQIGPAGSDRRLLVELALVAGYPIKEISQFLGIPEGTVKSRIHRLRQRLQRAIERGDEHDRASR